MSSSLTSSVVPNVPEKDVFFTYEHLLLHPVLLSVQLFQLQPL